MLTGKIMFGHYAEACAKFNIFLKCRSYDEMSDEHKAIYEQLATLMNERYITPLQGLIAKYSDLAEGYQNLTDNADDIVDSEWHEEKQALDARALVLLREENELC